MEEEERRYDPIRALEAFIVHVITLSEERTVAAIDDLNTALAALAAEQSSIATDVANVVALVGTLNQQVADLTAKVAAGVDPAAVEAAAQEVTATTAALATSASSLEGSLPAPPAA